MPKYHEEGAIPATFSQLRKAYLKFGLSVQELPTSYSSSPVKYVHDGVPYVIDCHHDQGDIPPKVAKAYILLERHHADVKRLHEAWQPLCNQELQVKCGGGLQLQAFFTAGNRYQGILYLSLIDDGRFAVIEETLRRHGVPFEPYVPDQSGAQGPHTLDVAQPWFAALPDVPNIKMRCQTSYAYR